MEIVFENLDFSLASQFKIDLIVWKYKIKLPEQDCNLMFKIDLIVWK